jgi:hypothetical protein
VFPAEFGRPDFVSAAHVQESQGGDFIKHGFGAGELPLIDGDEFALIVAGVDLARSTDL